MHLLRTGRVNFTLHFLWKHIPVVSRYILDEQIRAV